MPPTLYLIDGHALAYRTYYAIAASNAARLSTSSGELTAGVYGFASVLLRLLENDRPEYLAVAFDTGKTFRDTLFPEYKATREKMPDDLSLQMSRIRQLVDTFKIPRLEMEGFEADDVIGTLAKKAEQDGYEVFMMTPDKDYMQLLSDHIFMYKPSRSGNGIEIV
jgi:DNA polymerase-1